MDDLTNWLSFPLCPQSYLFLFLLLLFLCRQLKRACGRDERRDEKREEKKKRRERGKERKKEDWYFFACFPFYHWRRVTHRIHNNAHHTLHTYTQVTHFYIHTVI